jgi:hypothetical protein
MPVRHARRDPRVGTSIQPAAGRAATARFAAWREGLRAADRAESGEGSHVWANQRIFVGN